ncbi:MAG: hypothetical protein ACREQ5_01840, partial [Candidatus Dormibacteria bacterium]
MPGVNSGQYINTGGILSSGRLFLARNDLNLAVIRASDQTRVGGSIRLDNADAYLESFANNTNIETLWSQVAAIGSTKTLQLTPDATKSGVGVTPTMIMQYNTRVTSAIIQIGGVGIWVPLAMTGGYTAGAVAPAITLLPDGTLAFRGVLITPPAP